MQVRSLTGSEILLVEDEPLIAVDLAHVLECEGARVHHARDIEPALRMADFPSLTAGIIDLRLATGSAEAVCEKLAHRNVPFIFYTGAVVEPPRALRQRPSSLNLHRHPPSSVRSGTPCLQTRHCRTAAGRP